MGSIGGNKVPIEGLDGQESEHDAKAQQSRTNRNWLQAIARKKAKKRTKKERNEHVRNPQEDGEEVETASIAGKHVPVPLGNRFDLVHELELAMEKGEEDAKEERNEQRGPQSKDETVHEGGQPPTGSTVTMIDGSNDMVDSDRARAALELEREIAEEVEELNNLARRR